MHKRGLIKVVFGSREDLMGENDIKVHLKDHIKEQEERREV